MLDFNTFELALTELKDIHEKGIRLSDLLGSGVIEFTTGLETVLLSILEETSGDTESWIAWWLYEDVDKKVTLKNGIVVDLTASASLYNFLAMEANYGKDA